MTFHADFIDTLKELQKLPEVSLEQVSKLITEESKLEKENKDLEDELYKELINDSELFAELKDTPEFIELQKHSSVFKDMEEQKEQEETKEIK